jgi:hypothetical protein
LENTHFHAAQIGLESKSPRKQEGLMERYLIETPHTNENCLALLDLLHAQGFLQNFDWGCKAGVHRGWAIIEAESIAQAMLSVPPLVRSHALVIRLNKFDAEEVAQLHKDEMQARQKISNAAT